MNKEHKIISALAIAVIAMAGCAKEAPSEKTQSSDLVSQTQSKDRVYKAVEDEVVVELDDETIAIVEEAISKAGAGAALMTKSATVNKALADIGVKSVQRVFPDAGEREALHRKAGLHRFYTVVYDPMTTATKAVESLESLEGVLSVSKDTPKKRMGGIPFNDPHRIYQWYLYNPGTYKGFKAGSDVNVVPVWEEFTGGSKDVIVAVVDGGVNLNSKDLSPVMLPAGEGGSRNFLSGSYTINPDDHGSNVAGIIGAINNNGNLFCGIAGGLDGTGGVRLMSCEVFTGTNSATATGMAQAIIWAADNGALICNNSWGFILDSDGDGSLSETEIKNGMRMSVPEVLGRAFDYFNQNAGCDANGKQVGKMKGGLIVFSAGNDNSYCAVPAMDERVLAVGAVGPAFMRACYSNYGDWVDICAPGGDYEVSDEAFIYNLGKGDSSIMGMCGTSQAAPCVSGVAALLVSQYGGPGFTADDLKDRLLAGANYDHISEQDHNIGPMVDAYSSMTLTMVDPDPVTDLSANENGASITASWSATSSGGKVTPTYLLCAAYNKTVLETMDPNKIPDSVKSVIVLADGKKAGDKLEGLVADLDFDTQYYVGVYGKFGSRYSKLSNIVPVKTKVNLPPEIKIAATDYTLRQWKTLDIPFVVSDPEGFKTTVEITGAQEGTSLEKDGENYFIRIQGPKHKGGSYKFTIVATDSYKAQSTLEISYKVVENVAPEVIAKIPETAIKGSGNSVEIDLGKYFKDADDEPLTYEITVVSAGVASYEVKDGILRLTSGKFGLTSIRVKAEDAFRLSCEQSFLLAVCNEKYETEIYPNPVKDKLYISASESLTEFHVVITATGGAKIYDGTLKGSIFYPASVDMKACAPGLYNVKVEYQDKTEIKTIVKI